MNDKTKTAAGIDWREIHNRLEGAKAALEQKAAPSADEVKKVLKARAKVLAAEPGKQTRAGEEIEVVGFLLAYENYALESSFVREVWPLKQLSPLPGTPPFVAGIINVRGRIVSVINLKKFFDLPEKGLTDFNKVIIIRNDRLEFGLLTDAVTHVSRVSLAEIQPSLPTLAGIRREYLKGVTGGRLVVLDAAKILADPRVIVRDESSPGSQPQN